MKQCTLILHFMKNGAQVVSEAILGEDVKFVVIGGEVYSVKPPSIRTILKSIKHLSMVRLESEKYTKSSIMSEYKRNTKHIAMGLAVLLSPKHPKKYAKKFMDGTYGELLKAYNEVVGMMGGDDFFALAQLAKSLQKMAARPKS